MPTALTLFSLWISHFMVDFMVGIFAVYKTLAHLDLAAAGMLLFFSAAIGEMLQILSGELSDRGYRRQLIAVGTICAAGNLFLIYTSDLRLLFLCTLSTYIGSGLYHPASASYSSVLLPRCKGVIVTLFFSGGALGLALSQIGFYTLYTSLQTALWVLVALPVALSLYFLFKEKDPPGTIPQGFRSLRLLSIFALFRMKNLRYLYLTQVSIMTVGWSLIFLLPDLLRSRDLPEWITYGGGHAILISGSALSMIPSGYLADRFSIRKIFTAGILCFLIALYSFLIFLPNDSFLVLAMIFAIGLAQGAANTLGVAYGSQLYPSRPGLISAFLMGVVWAVAEGVGPGMSGLLAGCFERSVAPQSALLIMGSLLFIALFALGRVERRGHPRCEEWADI